MRGARAKRGAKRGPSARLAADRIHSAAIRLLRAARRQDSSSGLGPARLSALSVLVFRGPLSLKALAGAEEVKPPTMSRIVGALVEAGLARRSESSLDGRALRIEATARGRRVFRRARERRVAYVAEILRAAEVHELKVLLEAAEIIEGAVKGIQETGRS